MIQKFRLRNGPGIRTLTRRLAERVRQGWTPTQLAGAIAEPDLTTANNLAAVLITRTNDLGLNRPRNGDRSTL